MEEATHLLNLPTVYSVKLIRVGGWVLHSNINQSWVGKICKLGSIADFGKFSKLGKKKHLIR